MRIIVSLLIGLSLVCPVSASIETNLALDATANTYQGNDYRSPSRAIDGDNSTGWVYSGYATETEPISIYFDLSEIYTLHKINVFGPSLLYPTVEGVSIPGYYVDYTLSYSTNNVAYSNIGSGRLIESDLIEEFSDTWDTDVVARYIKYTVTGGTHWANLYEIEAYGEIPEPATLLLLGLGAVMLRKKR